MHITFGSNIRTYVYTIAIAEKYIIVYTKRGSAQIKIYIVHVWFLYKTVHVHVHVCGTVLQHV